MSLPFFCILEHADCFVVWMVEYSNTLQEKLFIKELNSWRYTWTYLGQWSTARFDHSIVNVLYLLISSVNRWGTDRGRGWGKCCSWGRDRRWRWGRGLWRSTADTRYIYFKLHPIWLNTQHQHAVGEGGIEKGVGGDILTEADLRDCCNWAWGDRFFLKMSFDSDTTEKPYKAIKMESNPIQMSHL